MAVVINHIIVHCRNKEESASFLADVLGLPAPTSFHWEHFAFLVDESDFDAIFARIQQRNIQFWSDPICKRPGEINTDDGGRSIYFKDPNNHLLEILTVPYGGEHLAAKYVP